MNREKRRVIAMILLAVYFLVLIGIFMSFSISTVESDSDPLNLFFRQLIYVGIGTLVLLFFSFFNYVHFKKLSTIMLIALFISLFLVEGPVAGRWIYIPFTTFAIQPSQFAPVVLTIFIAKIFSNPIDEKTSKKVYFLVFAIIILVSALIVFQPDFGSGFIIFGTAMLLLFITGVPISYYLLFLAVSLAGALGALSFSAEWRNRILAFFNPAAYYDTDAMQGLQALRALSRGGITGAGFMHSILKFPGHLPEGSSDFIFAIMGEEMGLIGCTVIIVVFLLFTYFSFRLSLRAKSSFARILGVGLTIDIVGWATVNMLVNVGLIPTTGVPLSFISFGGNNMVANLMSVGILINIIRQEVEI